MKNNLINKILQESLLSEDLFKPKNVSNRYEEERKRILNLLSTSQYFGDIDLRENKVIKTLGNKIQRIYGEVDATFSSLEDLGSLKIVDGDLYLGDTNIRSLNLLTTVTGNIDLINSDINSLGNLQHVGKNLLLNHTKNLETLGNLKTINGSLALYGSDVVDLGNLEVVGVIKISSTSKLDIERYLSKFKFVFWDGIRDQKIN